MSSAALSVVLAFLEFVCFQFPELSESDAQCLSQACGGLGATRVSSGASADFKLGDFKGYTPSQVMGVRRIVDDTLSVSMCVCPNCQYQYLKQVYNMPLSASSGSDTVADAVHVWGEFQLWVKGAGVVITPKSPNSSWLCSGGTRVKSVHIVWPGRIPTTFMKLRGHICGLVGRLSSLGFADAAVYIRTLDELLELYMLQYPLSREC